MVKALVVVCLVAAVIAQVPHRFSLYHPRTSLAGVAVQSSMNSMPAMNIEENVRKAEKANANDTKVFDFGQINKVSVNMLEAAQTKLENGTLYVMTFTMENALSFAFHFSKFLLTKGSAVFVVSENDVGGPWTHRNKWDNGDLMTRHIKGNTVAVHLFVSKDAEVPTVQIDVATTAFRAVLAGVCNIQSICRQPANTCRQGCVPTDRTCSVQCTYFDQTVSLGQWMGNDWDPQIRAGVAVGRNMNSRYCSGSFIDNQAGRQMVLTAAHCGPGPADIVQVGFADPLCTSMSDTIGDTSKVAGNLRFLARNTGVDNELIEVGEPIPPAWRVFLSGYDSTDIDNPAVGTTGIHHPAAANQKVCHSPLQVFRASWSGNANDHWRVNYWTEGTTEPGSSGSPLYSRVTKRIIGQLHGGSAACPALNGYDVYGAVFAGYAQGGMGPHLGPTFSDGRELVSTYVDEE